MSHAASPPEGQSPQPSHRDAILNRLAAQAAASARAPVVVVEGPYGSGKSTLLDRLAERLPDGTTVIRRRLDDYAVGDGDAVTAYRLFLDLLHGLALDIESAAMADFLADVTAEEGNARSRTDDGVLADVRLIARSFVRAWKPATNDRRAVVLADDASDALADQVGGWFVSLIARELPNTFVVLTRMSGPVSLDPDIATFERLGGLSPDDVGAVLAEAIGRSAPARVVDRVVAATGGHPGAVSQYASFLANHAEAGEEELLRIATDPSEELQQALDRIAGAMVKPLSDEAKEALELAAVPRRCTAPLLAKLVSGNEPSEEWTQKMRKTLRTLEEFGLVEYRQTPGTTESFAAVHAFLRSTINRDLRRDAERVKTLHALCEDHYWSLIQKRPEGYAGGDVLEEVQYNTDATEYLYHFQYTTTAQAPLMLLTTYFNAFWWWGWYAASEFCEGLVGDETYQASSWAAGWHETLRQFHAAYPRAADPAGDWSGTYAPLAKLLTVTDDGAPGTPADRAHLRAIIAAFLGQAHQFGKRDVAGARDWYGESLQQFKSRGPDDAWNIPWMLFYLADLERDLGEPDKAPLIAREAIALAEEQHPAPKRDYEVIASGYRVIGDVAFKQDASTAFAAYARAALAAYVFQGWPQPADEYTAEIYNEVTRHVNERLEALATNPAEVARATEAVNRVWSSAGAPVPEDGALFPPGPEPDDLGDASSDYVVGVRQITPTAVRVLSEST